MRVNLKDLHEAFEFVAAASGGEHQAFLCKQSGKLYCHSELCDDLDIVPVDIDDTDKFRQFFSRRGAYARFKGLLDQRGALAEWYAFETKAEEQALREWCELNSIEVSDEEQRPAA